MAETTTEGDLTGIEVTTGQKDTNWAENLPVAGNAVKTFNSAADAAEDGQLDPSELDDVMSDGKSFISSCGDAISGLTSADPISWLVSNGLDFLISTFDPLQDALHSVTGDGPALEQAAKNFTSIGHGVEQIRTDFEENVNKHLQDWQGEASETAGARLAEFSSGIGGVAGQAGDISQMLQASSKIMVAIEEFIKGLIADLLTFLIELWIPALAAAAFTWGGSTAAAASTTAIRAGTTIARSGRQVSKLGTLLQKFGRLLAKLSRLLKNLAQRTRSLQRTGTARQIGQQARSEATRSVKENAQGAFVPDMTTPGGIKSTISDVASYAEAGNIGNDASAETTSERLDWSAPSTTDGQWGRDRSEDDSKPFYEQAQPWDDWSLTGNSQGQSQGQSTTGATSGSSTGGSSSGTSSSGSTSSV